MADFKRETARKCWVKDLITGRYIKREGWEPNYFETSIGKVSRVNLLGVVINSDSNLLVIDDGSGKIQVRNFEEGQGFTNKVGDLVTVIGRPRVFNDNKYILSEIVKTIEDKRWILYRKAELQNTPRKQVEKNDVVVEKEKPSADISDALIQKLRELDKGFGVRIEELAAFFESQKAGNTINKLIEQGDIFEIKPGIIKSI